MLKVVCARCNKRCKAEAQGIDLPERCLFYQGFMPDWEETEDVN